ncbi:MAG: LPS export ABC transporter periplasmic protein LptC [Elusimicrobiota bacterium]
MEKKTLKFEIVAIFVLLCLTFLNSCSEEKYEGNKKESSGQVPGEYIKDFCLTETEKEKKNWILNAESAYIITEKEDGIIKVNNFNVDFFERNENITTLNARKGTYYTESKRLKTDGEVKIKSSSKVIITSNVAWDPKKKIFTTDEKVTVKTPDGSVKGIGMEADVNLQRIKIKKHISGEIKQ